MGGLVGERLCRQVRAREQARLQGQGDEHHRGPAELPGDGGRQDRRHPRGLAEPRRLPGVHEEREAREGGHERDRRHDRLVHPALPAEAVPEDGDVERSEGQGEPLQVARVGLAGDVPRRRSVLRPEGQGDHRGPRAQLQARRRGCRGGPGRTLEPALQAEEARHLLLVRPAVPERVVRPRQRQAPAAHEEVQGRREEGRRPEAVRVRVPVVPARQDHQRQRSRRAARRRSAW